MSTFLINQIQQNASFEGKILLIMTKNRRVFTNPFFGCKKNSHRFLKITTTPSKFCQVSKKIFAAPPVCGTVNGSSLKPCANKAKIAEVLGVKKNAPNIRKTLPDKNVTMITSTAFFVSEGHA